MNADTQKVPNVRIDLIINKYSSIIYLENGRSVVWNITINSDTDLQGMRLNIKFSPDFAAPQHYTLGEIKAGEPLILTGGCPKYDYDKLIKLRDEVPGHVVVELEDEDGYLLAQKEDDFQWLAFNAWAGGHEFPETLAALTLPYDPVVNAIMEDLRLSLKIEHPADELVWPGYDCDKEGICAVLNSLWDLLLKYGIEYNIPEERGILDFTVGQRVRTPSIIKEEGKSLCMDSTLLFAACTARLRLNPLVFLTHGHAFVGIMMSNTALPSLTYTPIATIRNLVEQGEILPIETTAFNVHEEAFNFKTAVEAATHSIRSVSTEDYFVCLDLEQIWHTEGIKPILGECTEPNLSGLEKKGIQLADEILTSQPAGRIERWQHKLLDLSLRNNLLNTCLNERGNIQLVIPDVPALEDGLAAGAAFKIKALPETAWREYTRVQQANNDDTRRILSEAAYTMFPKRELLSSMPRTALVRSLQRLEGASRREMEESGANTLYIACGFLRWVQQGGRSDHSMLAPILLMPVRISRTSARADYTLRGMDETALINHTLLELLDKEFGIKLPELEGDLPTDDSGLDVARIFDIVRKAVSRMQGWEVVETCSIGSYSFAKYLMWKDMSDRREALLKHPIVGHLATENRGSFPEQEGFPDPYSLDNEVDATQVFTPLPCDSSQLAAVLAAARGKNFVLVGPPGTGKSQTIANMIAHCLGHGKTVLFVAEKAVALEVVRKRLNKIGLGDFCLELHSNKCLMKEVMNQFRAAVESVSVSLPEDSWDQETFSMATLRYQLNLLPWEVHKPYPDGTSLYHDISNIAAHGHLPVFKVMEDDPLTCTAERKAAMLQQTHELARHYGILQDKAGACAKSIFTTDYSLGWEDDLAALLRQYAELAGEKDKATENLRQELGITENELKKAAPYIPTMMEIAAEGETDCAALIPDKAPQTLKTLGQIVEKASKYRELQGALSLPYPEKALDDAELGDWFKECRQTMLKSAPLRWLSMKKVARYLQMLATSTKQPDCLKDLQTLIEMRDLRKEILALNAPALPDALFKGVETGDKELQRARILADKLQQLHDNAPTLAEKLLGGGTARLANEQSRNQETDEKVSALEMKLADALGAESTGFIPHGPGEAREWAESMLNCKDSWQEIVLWNKQLQAARENGYGELAENLRSGAVSPQDLEAAAEVNFSRARLRAAVDSVETLREFSPLLHEERIRDFVQWDERLRKITGNHIRHLLTLKAGTIARFGQETAILQRELSKQKNFLALRKILSSTPNITPLLKPCFLMSPLSVSQYLTADTKQFDVVIFDEASQIPVWDAVGVIARGKSAIITGDPHQMPPTSFFGRSQSDDGDDAIAEQDMESILDECLACGIPQMDLTWHYRSKSEALIRFSNENYYENKMTTFPAPCTHDKAVQYHYCNGVYESGASKRVNPIEARAVVDHILETLRAPGFRYTEATSMGVVTFNCTQQALINELLEEERIKDPSLEPYFSGDDEHEYIFVKNLENVQGDERGVIYFSTTYGKDAKGKMPAMFGPLNLAGGEKRLNVAVTRARCAMHVFTSMKPEEINISKTRARGAADLKAFLEYARSGSMSSAEESRLRRDRLAAAVARELQEKGWKCATGIGTTNYRVDIAVTDPNDEERMLCGITIDGPEYAASHTARDRDVVRNGTMRMHGWRMLNIWAVDWWRHPQACLDRLVKRLEEYKAAGPVEECELPTLLESGEAVPAPEERQPEKEQETPEEVTGKEYVAYERIQAIPTFEMSDTSLMEEVFNIIDKESPVCLKYLLRRFGIARNKREANRMTLILSHLMSAKRIGKITDISIGDAPPNVFYCPANEGDTVTITLRQKGPRDWDEISVKEIAGASQFMQGHLKCIVGSDAHIKGVASFFGCKRLTKPTKEFLAQIVLRQAEHGDVKLN